MKASINVFILKVIYLNITHILEEISTYRNIHTFCLLLFAILNLFFNIWTFLSLLTLKRFSIKTQVEYTQGSSNYSIDARSQLGNIQILDMA